MTCTLYVAWDERLAGYDFGPGHPMAPVRLELTMELARAFGLFHLDGVAVEVPATDMAERVLLMHGLGTEDDPVFPGMHEAATMVTGATLAAA